MTTNRMARKTDKHFCPQHGLSGLQAVEEWFTINGAAVVADGDLTDCGARLIASSNFMTVNGRAIVRRGDTSDHGGLVIDGTEASEFVQMTDTTGLLLPIGTRFRGPPPPNVMEFVKTHYDDAKVIAAYLNSTPAIILGISGYESGWGASRFAKDYNNFFGAQSFHRYETGWGPAQNNPRLKMSIFPNYRTSLQSFAETNGRFIRGMRDPLEIGTTLQDDGKMGLITSTGQKVAVYPKDIANSIYRCDQALEILGKKDK